MIRLAPRLFPDEFVSCGLVRLCRITRLPIATVTREVTGRKWTPAFFQASHLQDIAALFDMSSVDLLAKHTIFPYAVAFAAPEAKSLAVARAQSVGVDARKVGPLTQTVSDHVPARRFCAQCAAEEQAQLGVSYWHRSQNLPGALVCLKHDTMLHEAKGASPWKVRDWSYDLPHEVDALQLAAVSVDGRKFLKKLAELSGNLLGNGLTACEWRSPSRYRGELEKHRLLSPGRQIDAQAFTEFVRAKIAGSIPESLTHRPGTPGNYKWVTLMARPGTDVAFMPVKHLIVQAALALSDRMGAGCLDHVPVAHYRGKDRVAIDEGASAELRRLVDGALAKGEKLSVAGALSQAGCRQLYRHSSDSLPSVSSEVKRLRTSAASLRRTSARRLAQSSRRRQK